MISPLGKDEEGRRALRWLRGDIQENILEEKLIRLELQTRMSGRINRFRRFLTTFNKTSQISKLYLI